MRISAFQSLLNSPRTGAACALAAALLLCLPAKSWPAHRESAKRLLIYSIDVEGGQATLLVGPAGDSLLVDTGWADHDGRDAARIVAAMHDAGVSKIDYLLITHYHADHVGGVPNLVARVPVGEFLDHGPNRENSDSTRFGYANYMTAIGDKLHRVLRPGDTIPMSEMSVVVITADGEHLRSVPGIKPIANPYCAGESQFPADPSENSRSVGILVRYGRFSFLDPGDLTAAKEVALVCPANPVGHVSLYLAANHGMAGANARAFVLGVHPLVAIMNNGPHKGNTPEAWQTVHSSPGLEDLWQLHTAEAPGAHNSPEPFIANPAGDGDGAFIKVTASENGSFTVTNSRSGFAKQYGRK